MVLRHVSILRDHPQGVCSYLAKVSSSLLSSPHTQQLYTTETLYLPGYITQGAVLRIIKETHNIKLTVHKYFF